MPGYLDAWQSPWIGSRNRATTMRGSGGCETRLACRCDHAIVVGEVDAIENAQHLDKKPVVWYQRGFHGLHVIDPG